MVLKLEFRNCLAGLIKLKGKLCVGLTLSKLAESVKEFAGVA